MSQYLPTGGFRWLSSQQIKKLERNGFPPEDSAKGLILEVDLEYPRKLHDRHSDYPLAPEHVNVGPGMLSPFQRQTYPESRLRKTRKLVPNLYDKTKYVVHYRNLSLYLKQVTFDLLRLEDKLGWGDCVP